MKAMLSDAKHMGMPTCCSAGAVLLLCLLLIDPSAVAAQSSSSASDHSRAEQQTFYAVSKYGEALPPLRQTVALDLEDASVASALEEIARQTGLDLSYDPARMTGRKRLSMQLKGSAVEALQAVLADTGQEALLSRYREIVVVEKEEPKPAPKPAPAPEPQVGVIEGIVTDAETGGPLPGASVALEGTARGASAGAEGQFRIADVEPGSYDVVASYVGYEEASKQATVAADEVVSVNFALQPSASELEQVVVTGNIIGTEKKKLATPVSVIPAEEIERIDPVSVMDIFETGRVPGVVSLDQGAGSNFFQRIIVRGSNSSFPQLTQTKVLIDGIEANSGFVSTIATDNIDRIEVIRGPQASTLYGADAAGGVVQIFTKDGSDVEGEQLRLSTRQGYISSQYVSDNVLDHQYRASLSGSLGGASYYLGGSYRTKDGYIPNYGQRVTTLAGGLNRSVGEKLDVSIMGSYFFRDYGNPGSPGVYYGLYEEGVLPGYYGDIDRNDRVEMRAIMLGANAEYKPFSWWTHNLTLGTNLVRPRTFTNPASDVPSDTIESTQITDYSRPTLRYATALQSPRIADLWQASLTLGFEYVSPKRMTTDISYEQTPEPFVTAQPGGYVWESNQTRRGYFGQLQVDVADQLFVTAGLRTDYNSNFGEEHGLYSTNPRLGVSALVEPLSGWTIKPRASWGTGIQSPTLRMIVGGAPFALPNPGLGPQTTSGWEVGADQYFMEGMASLSLTYYDQTTEDVIATEYIENPYPFRYFNLGELSSKGVEVEAEFRIQSLTVNANASYMDNEIVEIAESGSSSEVVGKPISGSPVPRTSGGLSATYDLASAPGLSPDASASITLSATYAGERWSVDNRRYFEDVSAGTYSEPYSDYLGWFDGYTKMNAHVRYDLNEMIGLRLDIRNALNNYAQDVPEQVTPGRRISLGASLTF